MRLAAARRAAWDARMLFFPIKTLGHFRNIGQHFIKILVKTFQK
jgi:hypothetical protein